MEHKNLHVSVIFKPQAGTGVFSIQKSGPGRSDFSCEAVEAKIFSDGETEVSLFGTLNDRIPYEGVAIKNSRSEKSLLRYVLAYIERDEASSKLCSHQAMAEIKSSILESTEITRNSVAILDELLDVFDIDFKWRRTRDKKAVTEIEKHAIVGNEKKKEISEVFEESQADIPPPEGSVTQREENLKKSFSLRRISASSEPLPYQSISGFLAIEVGTDEIKQGEAVDSISELEVTADSSYQSVTPISEQVQFMPSTARFIVGLDGAHLEIELLSSAPSKTVTYFFHVGRKSRKSAWVDYEAACNTVNEETGRFSLELSLKDFPAGQYEYTCYAQNSYTGECCWMGSYGSNLAFNIPRIRNRENEQRPLENTSENSETVPLGTYDAFSRWCFRQRSLAKTGILLEPLFFNESSRSHLLAYYEEALKRLSKRSNLRAAAVLEMFRTLGLSNVIMVTPEGPHAIAGGLAQVIVGLSETLAREGLSITLISPIYEQSWGNHHISFSQAITEGISLFGEKVIPGLVGDIHIDIPPTRWEGGVGLAHPRRVIRIEIYEAEVRGIRILFLRHKTLGDRLYGGISARDQMLRAVFLSRGALELCRDSRFGISPGVMLSHDWLAALIGPLLELDEKYLNDEKLGSFVNIHMLHNVGQAYQGRFHLVEQGEYLWPLLGLPDKHVGGFLDEDSDSLINFTKAACYHNKNALITVSKPYAEQLLEKSSGEGLLKTLREKSAILYGISNGIPQEAVRSAAFKRVSSSPDKFSSKSPRAGKSLKKSERMSIDEVLLVKTSLKTLIQSENQLLVNGNAPLAVFVGRLTEQKGLGLLYENFRDGLSVMEQALINFPDFQILVAGPPSYSDPAFIEFKKYFDDLSKRYPGRCAERYEFVPHGYAIELTAAADLFLMPSRYEPGGITQLEALAVGTTVVAHRVGGLSATLSQFKEHSGSSFLFEDFNVEQFYCALDTALGVIGRHSQRKLLVERTLSARNDWEHRVPYYLSLFQKVLGVFETSSSMVENFSGTRLELINRICARY